MIDKQKMIYRQIPEARDQIRKEAREGKTHKEILIHIAELFEYKSYLELGTQNPDNTFNHIPCNHKVSVDPDVNSKATFIITSKEFWESLSHGIEFDLIFIDGSHTFEESLNDLHESLEVLTWNGTIVMHDAKPWSEESQRIPRETQQWNGDVWKTTVNHVALADHLVYTIDCDFGVCCVHPFADREQKNSMVTKEYELFEKNKSKYLNLISIDKWYKKIKHISSLGQAGS